MLLDCNKVKQPFRGTAGIGVEVDCNKKTDDCRGVYKALLQSVGRERGVGGAFCPPSIWRGRARLAQSV